jgi:formylglycine-generating enzyme required for sulfatase activity
MGASTTGEHNVDPEAKDHEGPVHQLTLGGFWMGQHPISNAQYRCFVRATGRAEPQCWRQEGYEGDEQPVTTVGLADARDFCRWLSQETGEVLRLPTEAQWEYAARGKAGRRYPWGEELPTFERAVFGWQRLASNGGRPLGATPEGVHDLAGQIWEWTCSPWGAYPTAHDRDLSTHDRFVDTSSGAATRVVRGGSWDDSAGRLRAAYRRRWRSGDRDVSLGFRVVLLREPAG